MLELEFAWIRVYEGVAVAWFLGLGLAALGLGALWLAVWLVDFGAEAIFWMVWG